MHFSLYLALLKKKKNLDYFLLERVSTFIMQTKFSINLGHRNITDPHYYIYLINLLHMLIRET